MAEHALLSSVLTEFARHLRPLSPEVHVSCELCEKNIEKSLSAQRVMQCFSRQGLVIGILVLLWLGLTGLVFSLLCSL